MLRSAHMSPFTAFSFATRQTGVFSTAITTAPNEGIDDYSRLLKIHTHVLVDTGTEPMLHIIELDIHEEGPIVESLDFVIHNFDSDVQVQLTHNDLCSDITWVGSKTSPSNVECAPPFMTNITLQCTLLKNIEDHRSKIYIPVPDEYITGRRTFIRASLLVGTSKARISAVQMLAHASQWCEPIPIYNATREINITSTTITNVFNSSTTLSHIHLIKFHSENSRGISVDYLSVLYFIDNDARQTVSNNLYATFTMRKSAYGNRISLTHTKKAPDDMTRGDFYEETYISSGIPTVPEYRVLLSAICKYTLEKDFQLWTKEMSIDQATLMTVCNSHNNEMDIGTVGVLINPRRRRHHSSALVLAALRLRNPSDPSRRMLSTETHVLHAVHIE
jgi:hypothetical protein